jgi:hypothetical protein
MVKIDHFCLSVLSTLHQPHSFAKPGMVKKRAIIVGPIFDPALQSDGIIMIYINQRNNLLLNDYVPNMDTVFSVTTTRWLIQSPCKWYPTRDDQISHIVIMHLYVITQIINRSIILYNAKQTLFPDLVLPALKS